MDFKKLCKEYGLGLAVVLAYRNKALPDDLELDFAGLKDVWLAVPPKSRLEGTVFEQMLGIGDFDQLADLRDRSELSKEQKEAVTASMMAKATTCKQLRNMFELEMMGKDKFGHIAVRMTALADDWSDALWIWNEAETGSSTERAALEKMCELAETHTQHLTVMDRAMRKGNEDIFMKAFAGACETFPDLSKGCDLLDPEMRGEENFEGAVSRMLEMIEEFSDCTAAFRATESERILEKALELADNFKRARWCWNQAPAESKLKEAAFERMVELGAFSDWSELWRDSREGSPLRQLAAEQMKLSGGFADWLETWHMAGNDEDAMFALNQMTAVGTFDEWQTGANAERDRKRRTTLISLSLQAAKTDKEMSWVYFNSPPKSAARTKAIEMMARLLRNEAQETAE